MEKLQLIVDCEIDDEKECLINQIGRIVKRLPLIDSYIIEISSSDISKLEGIIDINSIYSNTKITAQMDTARKVVKADIVNKNGFYGENITVAILDTGVSPVKDFTFPRNRIIAFKDVINNRTEPYDDNGHGTHVTGILAGNGYLSNNKYLGIAPKSNIVGVKILDSEGKGNVVDALNGLQWISNNAKKYNIKILNLSIGTPDKGDLDPLVRAVEKCWDMGIVVCIAAGNNGPEEGSVTSPGVSRKIITVGAVDDHNTVSIWGEALENYSGRGPTKSFIKKPDVIAPGTKIISCCSLTSNIKSTKDNNKLVNNHYIELSGTSMATPIVSGAVALLLNKYKSLHPDSVKLMIKKSVIDLNYPRNQQGWGLLDIENLLKQEARNVR